MQDGRKLIHAVPALPSELPDGAVVAGSGSAFTIAGGLAFRWTEQGYEAPREIGRADGMLTPPSTFAALAQVTEPEPGWLTDALEV